MLFSERRHTDSVTGCKPAFLRANTGIRTAKVWQRDSAELDRAIWSHKRKVACRIRGTTHQAHSFDEHKKLLHLGP